MHHPLQRPRRRCCQYGSRQQKGEQLHIEGVWLFAQKPLDSTMTPSIPTFHDNPSFCASCWQPSPAPDAKVAMGWMHTGTLSDHRCPAAPPAPHRCAGNRLRGPLQRRQIHGCINTLTSKSSWPLPPKNRPRTPAHQPVRLGKQGVTDAVLADLPATATRRCPLRQSCAGSR